MLNKIERLFFKYNIELFIIGFLFCVGFIWAILESDDIGARMIGALLGSLLIIPIFLVAISKSLQGTKNIFCIIFFIFNPIMLIYIYFNRTDFLSMIDMILGMMLINAVVYRSYLNTKYKVER